MPDLAKVAPYNHHPLSLFSIGAMNHYNENGVTKLYVLMTRGSHFIKHEGIESHQFWCELIELAETVLKR